MRAAIAGILILLAAGCASTDTVTIPKAPAWQLSADARPVSGFEARVEILKVAPFAKVEIRDASYTRISHAWLERYVSWTWEAAKATGIRYTPESFDCENFAGLFLEIARSRAAAAGEKVAPLAALVVVRMPDNGLHALVGVATDRGIYIVEPQPDAGPFRIRPLSEYVGRILEVEL